MTKKCLYILCEAETDEMFYECLAERVTGMTFLPAPDFRNRQGGDWKSVLALARLVLNWFGNLPGKQDIALIIAVDNDRAPGHPGSSPLARPLCGSDLKKAPRYPALRQLLFDKLGEDRSRWPVDVALAVPVEMMESWLLLLLDPMRPELPLFSEADSASARNYYGAAPPAQLKDLTKAAAREQRLTLFELFWTGAHQGDLKQLAARLPSFALFEAELLAWRP